MSEWQPIETAPRDGTQILAAGFAPNGVYNASSYHIDDVRHACAGIIRWLKVTGSDGMWCGGFGFIPTHWQPLPQLPSEADVRAGLPRFRPIVAPPAAPAAGGE